MEQRIKSLIEKRTIQALQNEVSKKLHTIVRAFGRPIIEQTVPYVSLPDFWELDAPEIPEVYDDNIYLRGYYFDGLSRGINLCIKLLIYDGRVAHLEAIYNGYIVYTESDGDLKSYAPFPSWEEARDRLYEYAKPIEQEKIKEEKKEKKEKDRKKAMNFMQKLRILWGI